MSNAFPQIQYLIILYSLKLLSISAEIVREKKSMILWKPVDTKRITV